MNRSINNKGPNCFQLKSFLKILYLFGVILFLLLMIIPNNRMQAQISPSGSETIVNTTTAGTQQNPAVAMDSSGNFIVVWESYGEDGDGFGIYAQRYFADGSKNGSQFKVNNSTVRDQRFPDVAMSETGITTIVWMSNHDADIGRGWDCFKRMYDAAGGIIVNQSRLNSTSSGDQKFPKVAMNASGESFFTWMSEDQDGDDYGIYGRHTLVNGANTSSPYIINSTTAGFQGFPDIDANNDGTFVVTWQTETDGNGSGIFGQLFNSDRTMNGSEFVVNSTTTHNQQEPAIVISETGHFGIFWSSYLQDSDQMGVFGRIYNTAGTSTVSEFQVNTTTSKGQDHISVATSEDGYFIITWSSYGQDGNRDGVYAQVVRHTGVFVGLEQKINTRTTDFQQFPGVAAYQDTSKVIIAWQDGLRNSTSTHDGSNYGVYIQLMALATDTIPPVAICTDTVVYLNGAGTANITADLVDGGSTDNDGILSRTTDITSVSCSDLGGVTVVLTVTDSSGNTATCSSSVGVFDNLPPSLSCPGNTQQLLNTSCQFSLSNYTGSATVSDNCDVSPTVTQSPLAGTTISNAGTVTVVTLTATDASGNTSTCSFSVTAVDTVKPTITCPGNQTVHADASCDASLPDYTGSASTADNCDPSPTVTQSPVAGTVVSGAGTVVIVTLTSTDASGNAKNCSFTVTIADTTRPTITCPSNTNEYLDANCEISLPDYTGAATAADNCDPSPTITQSPVAGTTITGAGTVTVVVLTATDASGNTNSCSFSVTTLDTIPPQLTCPANTTETLDASCDVSLPDYTGSATATDNCDPNPAVSQTPVAGTTVSGAGTVVAVTLTATDASGNTSTCSFNVTLVDDTAPSITCPGNQTDALDGNCDASLPDFSGLAIVSDNCDPSPAVTQSPVTGTTVSGSGTSISVTLMATDASGNTSTCSFSYTVNDSTPPSISCPINQTLAGDANCEALLPDYTGSATVSDNCDPNPVVTQSPAAGITVTPLGQTVILTATDASGNTSTCSFNATTIDVLPPSLTCPGNQIRALDASCQASLNDYTGAAVVTDNCDPNPVVTQSPASGSIYSGAGTSVTVTLTATDAVGNTSTCSFSVTFNDSIPPSITCPGTQSAALDASCKLSLPDYTGLAIVFDNCDPSPTVIQSPIPGTTVSGANTAIFVSLTVTDASGNTNICSFLFVTFDNTGPILSCPGDTTMTVDASCNATLPDFTGSAIVSDNCDPNPTVTQSPVSGTVLSGALTVTTVTLTATDVSGNTSTCSLDVTLSDTIPPTITCPGSQSASLDGNCEVSLPDFTGLGSAADNCDPSPAITQSPSAGTSVSGVGTSVTVTLIATDASGNTSTCNFNFTTFDSIPPSLTCPVNQTLPGDVNCEALLPDYTGSATVSDNCDPNPVVTQSPASGTTVTPLGLTVTLTATDASGNTSTCSFNATTVDVIPPNLTCPGTQTQFLDANCQSSLLDYTGSATVSDNCDPNPVVTQSPASGNIYSGAGTSVTVTLTATDAVGNTSTCSFSVQFTDSTRPSITCPVNQTENVDANCNFSLPDYTGLASFADNCDPLPAVTQSPTPGTTVSGAGTVTVVTLTVTDASGNTHSCSFTVTNQDIIPPTIACPGNQNIYYDSTCSAALGNYTGLATPNDNCDPNPIVTQSPAPGTIYSGYGPNITVTLTATDASGNTATCSLTAILTDTIKPTIICPGIQTESQDSDCMTPLPDYTGLAVLWDNCEAPPSISQSPAAGTLVSGHGTVTAVTLTVSDNSGNSNTCTFNVTFIDDTPPLLTCPSDTTIFTDPDSCSAVVNYITPFAADNCDASPTVIQLQGLPSGSTYYVGSVYHLFIVTDAAGNTSTCEFTIVVDDTNSLMPICPPDTCIFTDSGLCEAFVYIQEVNFGGCLDLWSYKTPISISNPNATLLTDYQVRLVINTADMISNGKLNADGSDLRFCDSLCNDLSYWIEDYLNTDTTVVWVKVLSIPASGSQGIFMYYGNPSANPGSSGENTFDFFEGFDDSSLNLYDECGSSSLSLGGGIGSLSWSSNGIWLANRTFDLATVYTAEAKITGASGNWPAIYWYNNTPKSYALLINSTQARISLTSASSTYCSAHNWASSLFNYSSVAGIWKHTWVANGDIQSYFPTVGPITTNNASYSRSADMRLGIGGISSGTGSMDMDWLRARKYCPIEPTNSIGSESAHGRRSCIVSITNDFNNTENASGSYPLGNTLVTFTVIDISGHTNTCTFNVTVKDTIPPTIVKHPYPIVWLDSNGTASINPGIVTDTIYDYCSIDSMWTVPDMADCDDFGTIVYTVYVIDGSGNIDSCTGPMGVFDAIWPIAVCKDTTILLDSAGNGWLQVASLDNGSWDNCFYGILNNLIHYTSADVGVHSVMFIVYDNAYNLDTCWSTVTVTDGFSPIIACTDTVVFNDPGLCSAVVFFNPPTSPDPNVTFAQTGGLPTGSVFPVGVSVITYIATAPSGNTSSCSFTITVIDNEPPVISCPSDRTRKVRPGKPGRPVGYLTPTAIDNCGVASITHVSGGLSGAFFPVGNTTVIWKATDIHGNMSTCSFVVTVIVVQPLAMENQDGKDGQQTDDGKDGSIDQKLTEDGLGQMLFEAYPNPTTGQITVQVERRGYAGKIQIEIFDILGRKVYDNAGSFENVFTHNLDLRNEATGQYMLRLRLGDVIKTKKIVLIH